MSRLLSTYASPADYANQNAARFWSRVAIASADECWEWQRGKVGGYGTINWMGRDARAPRVAYTLAVGPIPAGLHILHSCDNTGCVNPAHLRADTPSENSKDIVRHGYHHFATRTHCPVGHPYSEQNTRTWGGKRYCLTCRHAKGRINAKRYRDAKRLIDDDGVQP
jgi:hypothetical protein